MLVEIHYGIDRPDYADIYGVYRRTLEWANARTQEPLVEEQNLLVYYGDKDVAMINNLANIDQVMDYAEKFHYKELKFSTKIHKSPEIEIRFFLNNRDLGPHWSRTGATLMANIMDEAMMVEFKLTFL